METRNRIPDGSCPLAICNEPEFLARLERTIADCARGQPGALIHMDVARARDIRTNCGAEALNALREFLNTLRTP